MNAAIVDRIAVTVQLVLRTAREHFAGGEDRSTFEADELHAVLKSYIPSLQSRELGAVVRQFGTVADAASVLVRSPSFRVPICTRCSSTEVGSLSISCSCIYSKQPQIMGVVNSEPHSRVSVMRTRAT